MANTDEQINSKRSRFTLKHIITVIVITVLSFAGFFLIGRTVLSSPEAGANQGIEIGPLYNSPEFTVNIANSNGRRFLMTQFSLEVDNKKTLKEIEEKLPVFQDKVIIVLSSQTLDDLYSVDGKENIKNQLIENINTILSSGKIINIYFNNFVYQ
ncbi:MAG: flagellar basal body-associated FliL family protein [Peptococcaceae bacterium]